MKFKSPYPLARLPHTTDMILALLCEELKANFFFNTLRKTGLDDCDFQPCLGSVILTLMGFDTRPDNLLNYYLQRLDHHSKKLQPHRTRISKQALKLYLELRQEKKRRQNLSHNPD